MTLIAVGASIAVGADAATDVRLGGPDGLEVQSDFRTSAAWVTDSRGRTTGRPPWAIERGWQVFLIPESDYSGPRVDQFLLPSGAYRLHVHVRDESFPARILVHGRAITGAPTAAASFFLPSPLEDATLSLRFGSGRLLSSLRLAVDRGSDGRIEDVLEPNGIVTNSRAISSDYEGPRLTVTSRPGRSSGRRISIAAADPVGVTAVYYSVDGGPVRLYRGPFEAARTSKLLVIAADALGNAGITEGRTDTFRR